MMSIFHGMNRQHVFDNYVQMIVPDAQFVL